MAGPTHDEVVKACKEAGYGEELPENYNDSSPVTIRIGDKVGVMPKWMAEVYGHIGHEKEKNRDGNNTAT